MPIISRFIFLNLEEFVVCPYRVQISNWSPLIQFKFQLLIWQVLFHDPVHSYYVLGARCMLKLLTILLFWIVPLFCPYGTNCSPPLVNHYELGVGYDARLNLVASFETTWKDISVPSVTSSRSIGSMEMTLCFHFDSTRNDQISVQQRTLMVSSRDCNVHWRSRSMFR